MQTFEQLRQTIRLELNGKSTRIPSRRAKISALSEKLRRWQQARRADKRYRIRTRGASLTINESTLLKGGKSSLYLNVEVLGACVGTIEFSVGKAPAFSPADSFRKIPVDGADQRLSETLAVSLADRSWKAQWTKNQRDGDLLNYFLLSARKSVSARNRQDERVIQALLNRALAGRKTGTRNAYTVFKGFRPVAPGAAMEIGTVLSATPSGKTGQADILVRHDAGADTEFLVFELKAPDGDDPAAALTQAIRYALSLESEANVDVKTMAAYRHLFGSNAVAPLRFGAVAVVAEEHEADAAAALRALGSTGGMSVGILLYQRVANWGEARHLPVDGLRFLGLD